MHESRWQKEPSALDQLEKAFERFKRRTIKEIREERYLKGMMVHRDENVEYWYDHSTGRWWCWKVDGVDDPVSTAVHAENKKSILLLVEQLKGGAQ